MRRIKNGFCGFGFVEAGQDPQYIVKLGEIEARSAGAQECWDLFLTRIKDAVLKGEVTKDYQFGEEITHLYESFNVLITIEKNKRIVREEKARLAMIDFAKHERYQA